MSDSGAPFLHSFYETIFNRRDVRGQFKPDPIPDQTLNRILS